MERIITSLLLIFSTDFFIESLPIKNGFSIKFKPFSSKEVVYPKTFGAIFAKISQEFTPEAILRREIFAKSMPAPSPDLGTGCSNQVARVMYPMKRPDNVTTAAPDRHDWTGVNYLNLPTIKQPYKDYKVLVAEAPKEMKMNRNNEKMVIYIVFSEDASDAGSNPVSIPEIYFVNRPKDMSKASKNISNKNKINQAPLIIMDQNRTVTGLKRKQVEKLIKFRNDQLKRYNDLT